MKTFRMHAFSEIQGGKEKFEYLDLLRGIAAIVILIVHYKHFFQGVDGLNLNSIVNVVGYSYWSSVYHWGSNAVQLFWLISGFVFIHVYGGLKTTSWRTFLVHRFARLYPLHIFTLFVVVAIQFQSESFLGEYLIYQINDLYHFILNLFFASEWGLQEGRSFNGPIWSVSVEIFSYIAFFIILKHLRVNIVSVMSIIFVCTILYIKFKSLILLCLIYFFTGILAYSFYLFIRKFNSYQIIAFLFCMAILLFKISLHVKNFPLLPFYLVIFTCLVVATALSDKLVKPVKKLRWIGDTSYGNYLWHSPLQMLFLFFTGVGVLDINIIYEWYFIYLYILVVTGTSLFMFYVFEKPMQKIIRARF